MKNKMKWYPVVVVLCITLAHCTRYDDYKKYMPDGGYIYPQKADSLKTFPGKNRILLEWVIVDPKVTACKVIYEQSGIRQDTVVSINADGKYESDTIRVTIFGLEEATYAFKIISYDDFGNASIPVETTESAYGSIYEDFLVNRVLRSAEFDDDNGLQLQWYAASDTEIGVLLDYTDIHGEKQTLKVEKSETATHIPDFKFGEPLYGSTMYKPVPSAIDTFSANQQRVNMQQMFNIALNKPVTHSSALNETVPGQNAVDGNKTENWSRWICDGNFEDQWIVINFEAFYTISATQIWFFPAYEPSVFRLQADIEGEWVNVVSVNNRPSTIFYIEFESVITDRVRLFFPAPMSTQDRLLRLFEIEVYAVINF